MTMKRSISLLQKVAALAFSLALVAALIPTAALATTMSPQAGVVASGMSGDCEWEIDDEGKLTIRPGAAGGKLGNSFGDESWRAPQYAYRVTSAVIEPGVKAGTNVNDMFNWCENMVSVDLTGLDTASATSIRGMFYYCKSLKSVSLLGRHTENATDMGSLFYGCENLEEINLSGVNTAKVQNMSGMFYGCSSLKTLNLSSFDTSNVTNMSVMFQGCESLTGLDLSNFKTGKLKNAQSMFDGCSSLKSLDLSNFDTSKVDSMDNFFNDCTEIDRITLGPKFEFVGDSKLPNADWLSSETGDSVSSDGMTAGDGPITFVKDKGDNPGVTPPVIKEEDKPEPWDPGSSDGMEIKTDIDPDDLVCVKVDGKVVDKENYTVDEETGAIVLKPEYLEKLGGGDHSIDFVTSNGTASTEFKVTGDSKPANPDDPGNSDDPNNPSNGNNGGTTYGHLMLRLYNPNSGEHFFTVSPVERDNLVWEGWRDEGIGWVAPTTGSPVYRLYNPIAGEHHYTLASAERDMLVDAGWNYEGVGWYSDADQKIPLYRLYNPYEYANNHHYTTSEYERDHLISVGWRDEGVGWHGISK